jgi:hypothetical protein
MLYVIFMLNVIDAWLTLAWVKTGLAVEANPLMAGLLSMGDAWFIGVKISAVAIACGALCMLREHTLAKRLSVWVCIVYMIVMLTHCHGLRLLWFSLS